MAAGAVAATVAAAVTATTAAADIAVEAAVDPTTAATVVAIAEATADVKAANLSNRPAAVVAIHSKRSFTTVEIAITNNAMSRAIADNRTIAVITTITPITARRRKSGE